MTKKSKRIKKIRQNPKTVTFEDLRIVLEDHGFVMRGGEGTSHHFFRAEFEERVWTLTLPFKKPFLNDAYVKRALKMIDEIIELREETEEESVDDDEQPGSE